MSRRRLDSWKEIADFFARDRTVVARWERERGLPVHRVPGGGKARVFAYTDELEQWLQSAPAPESPSPRSLRTQWLALAAALLLMGAAAAAWWTTREPAAVARVNYTADAMIALDEGGREVFRKAFPNRLFTAGIRNGLDPLARWDFDHDGHADNLITVPLRIGDGTSGSVQDRLDAYRDDGTLLWSQTNAVDPLFGAGRFGPGYHTVATLPFSLAGNTFVAWSQTQVTWWPTILRILDDRGRVTSTWTHSGVFFAMSFLDRSAGPLLLAGGVSNSQSAGALLVLDPRHANGFGPEDPGSEFACRDCRGDDRFLHYFVFPPTEMSAAYGVPYSRTYAMSATPNGLEVRVRQGSLEPHLGVDVDYYFDGDFHLIRAQVADDYWIVHKEMEAKGLLHHSAGQCPERSRPLVVRELADQQWRVLTPGRPTS